MNDARQALNVVIVGGGPGCKAIADMILKKRLTGLRMHLLGVASTNPNAAGHRFAQDKGIVTTQDYHDFYRLKDLDMIIELTGRDEVAEEIMKTRPEGVRVMDHVVSRLFWDIFQLKARELEQRDKVQAVLSKAKEDLEQRVEESTRECSRSKILLQEEVGERKLIEQELLRKNKELEDFVNAISHDLKSPIISVQGFAALALKRPEIQLDEKATQYLKQIQASGQRMERLIADLLSLVKTGQVDSDIQDVSMLELAKELASALQPRLDKKSIDLVIADDLPTIRCDKERIRQVLENLLINAVKFMGDTPKPRIEVGYEDKSNAHQFCVKDNGIGIDSTCHSKIFRVFQQLKEVKEEGTGIGLAIVAKIIENHGGKVWVESEKGNGATFCFSIPKEPKANSCQRH